MDVEQEFSALMKLLKVGLKGGKVSVDTLCAESLRLFDAVKEKAVTGTVQEKEKLAHSMSQMYRTLLQETQAVAGSLQLDEEQLKKALGVSGELTEEHKKLIYNMKHRLSDASSEITRLLALRAAASKEDETSNS